MLSFLRGVRTDIKNKLKLQKSVNQIIVFGLLALCNPGMFSVYTQGLTKLFSLRCPQDCLMQLWRSEVQEVILYSRDHR